MASPAIIAGPARSGTSILFELLALHPDLRAPLGAEALHPVPLPESGLADRREMGECEQEFWADIQSEFLAMHEFRADLPVECITLTTGSFAGYHWSMIAPLTGWISDPDVNFSYERQILLAGALEPSASQAGVSRRRCRGGADCAPRSVDAGRPRRVRPRPSAPHRVADTAPASPQSAG